MEYIPVYVVVGEWGVNLSGFWAFFRRKDQPVRQINIAHIRSYNDLLALVANAYNINQENKIIKLSYWTPDVTTPWGYIPSGHLRIPPIRLFNSISVLQYLHALARRPSLGLFAEVEDRYPDGQNEEQNEQDLTAVE